MTRIVFMLEEASMRAFLEALLPRLVPGMEFLCITHEGKQDLEKSIPRKLRGWDRPGDRFVVVRDNDNGDCKKLKQKLNSLCAQSGRVDVLVRIPCQALEAWYLGEPAALAKVFGKPGLATLGRKARFRDPDAVVNPSSEIKRLVPEFQKVSGARQLGAEISASSGSRSFQVFLAGVRKVAAGMPGRSSKAPVASGTVRRRKE